MTLVHDAPNDTGVIIERRRLKRSADAAHLAAWPAPSFTRRRKTERRRQVDSTALDAAGEGSYLIAIRQPGLGCYCSRPALSPAYRALETNR